MSDLRTDIAHELGLIRQSPIGLRDLELLAECDALNKLAMLTAGREDASDALKTIQSAVRSAVDATDNSSHQQDILRMVLGMELAEDEEQSITKRREILSDDLSKKHKVRGYSQRQITRREGELFEHLADRMVSRITATAQSFAAELAQTSPDCHYWQLTLDLQLLAFGLGRDDETFCDDPKRQSPYFAIVMFCRFLHDWHEMRQQLHDEWPDIEPPIATLMDETYARLITLSEFDDLEQLALRKIGESDDIHIGGGVFELYGELYTSAGGQRLSKKWLDWISACEGATEHLRSDPHADSDRCKPCDLRLAAMSLASMFGRDIRLPMA